MTAQARSEWAPSGLDRQDCTVLYTFSSLMIADAVSQYFRRVPSMLSRHYSSLLLVAYWRSIEVQR